MVAVIDLDFGAGGHLYATHQLHAFAARCPAPVARWAIESFFLASPVGSVVAVFQFNRRESPGSCVAFAVSSLAAGLSGLPFTALTGTYSSPVAIVAARKGN